MDWFLLLTPLILLPIVVLFVFVGCTLPRSGTKSASVITFQYDKSVSDLGSGFSALFSPVGLEVTLATNPLTRTSNELVPDGETILAGSTALDAEGKITCTCTVDGHLPIPLTKQKVADEDISFWLRWEKPEAAGGKYFLV
jgi:hypothetical protein